MKKKAYITGASSGIGREFALQLMNSYDLVLIARNPDQLKLLASEIQKLNDLCKVQIESLDLTKYEDLSKASNLIANDLSLGILINNAGFGTVGEFATLDIEKEQNQIHLNINALVQLTHSALNNFKSQKSGSIVNVASIAGYLPAPFSATYAATKAFVCSFTESIHEEAKQYGIHIQSLCPGLTHSDFHQRAGIDKSSFPNIMWMKAEDVVKESLKSIKKNQAVCIPGAVNQTAVGLMAMVPTGLTRRIAGQLMKK
ncbi:SDR family NAD(P)-dependent oxidoreductase [Leptospira sp. GIMC2001]|uniref:SDR family NAD(P)-dependent oxidoreductase n=1 Tax=Leptospira sp. GIMC2001 TaxID=1513297 RepID=UPI00234A01D7|nr:SDR family oxidoreductase [Leptospira sp. GIMC2001]WCL49880.1 SDR family oxidoreductase [Leptospira sp. GIMC2001]